LQFHIERYLSELLLIRKPQTENRARQILFEAIPHLTGDPRSGAIAYLHACKQRGNDNRTLENKRIRLQAFFRTAGVALKLPKFRFVVRKPEMYTPAEITAIFGAANGRDLWLFKTLLMAGLRMQEAMNLTYLDLLDAGIRVTAHGDWTPKDHEERIAKVPRSLVRSLRELPQIRGAEPVFPSQRGGVNWHMLRSIKRTAARAGMDPDKAWLHKFRANFCTTLLRAGVPVQDVMTQMGHSKLESTLRYMALLEHADLQEKVEMIWESCA
jgi:integrase